MTTGVVNHSSHVCIQCSRWVITCRAILRNYGLAAVVPDWPCNWQRSHDTPYKMSPYNGPPGYPIGEKKLNLGKVDRVIFNQGAVIRGVLIREEY